MNISYPHYSLPFKKVMMRFLLLFITSFLILTGLHAQDLYVKKTDGSQRAFALESVQKLMFAAGNMIVLTDDINPAVYPLSEIRYFTFEDMSPVKDELLMKKPELILLYPNPVKDIIQVEYYSGRSIESTIEIVDITGNVAHSYIFISTSGKNTAKIVISDLAPGIYFCRLKYGDSFSTKKFIKE